MDTQSLLLELRNLVDSYEDLLTKGKLILLSREFNTIDQFISSTKNIVATTHTLLPLAKTRVMERESSDPKLHKYLSTYYRMLILIDIPYLVSILRQIAEMLKSKEETRASEQLTEIANDLEEFMDILKP